MARCIAITKKGSQCKLQASKNALFCSSHLYKTEYFEKQIEHEFNVHNRFYTPYMRIIVSTVFFLIIFLLTQENQFLNKYFEISSIFGRDFFLAELQIWATLTGFYVAIIIITIQIISSERSKFIDLFQDKLEKITEEINNSPESVAIVKDKLQEMLIELRKQLYSMYGNENVPNIEKLVKFQNFFRNYAEKITAAYNYIFRIDLYLDNIMRIIRRSINSYFASVAIKKIVAFLSNLLAFLFCLFILYISFGIVDKQDIFPNINIPIILTSFLYSFLLLINFLRNCRNLFHNLRRWK
jgi:hypothetical protein